MSDKGVQFKFKRNANIGTADAETDDKFLFDCFLDTGDLDVLRDTRDPKRIVVGRTGAGKSALLRQLKEIESNVIEIEPETLSLNYISNSDILMFLDKAGVKLDLFFGLLWKHVFAVELLKNRYALTTEDKTRNWLSAFLGGIGRKDKSKEKALNYLSDWGNKFWNETEYRIKEFTTKLEEDLKGAIGTSLLSNKLDSSAGFKLTEEQKIEVIHRAQKAVNSIQIKELSDVVRLLSEDVFNDPQQRYFVVIDRLDENWVDENLRRKLIRALIETVKSFQKIPTVKIVVAIRHDLLRSVFDATRDAGFQEEKYESLMLRLRWSRDQLGKLLNRRIAALVREQYTTRDVGLSDIFPEKVGKVVFLDYLVQRTLMRPRDAILFVNECLLRSENNSRVTVQSIQDAEGQYSQRRLESLEQEWIYQYPSIGRCFHVLDRAASSFKLQALPKDNIEGLIVSIMESADVGLKVPDPIRVAINQYLNSSSQNQFFITIKIFLALFDVGVVGIRPDSFTTPIWSHSDTARPSEGQIKPTSTIYVHPIVWRSLGIRFD